MTGASVHRHRLALLALLALAPGRRLSRDKLIAYLWPERGPEKGRNLLKQAIYVLRAVLGEDALLSEGDEVRLGERVVTDAAEFDLAIQRLDFLTASCLYRGPFMDGFFLSGAAEFEEWSARERQRLADAYSSVLENLAVAAEASEDWTGATEWWKKRSAQDPFDTRVALRLIRALDASGSRAMALQHAAIHQRLLSEEFELDTPPELQAAVERLHRQPSRPSDAPTMEPASERAPVPPIAAPRRRRPRVLLAVAAVLLVTAATLGMFARRAETRDRPSPRTQRVDNAEAHRHYLRGRYFWNKRTERDIQRALEYYEQAVDLDPGYAPAWVGIADTWISRGWYARLAPHETFPKAKHAALRALEFDSTLSAAHASLAHVHLRFDHDWPAAEREYLRAIQLEPTNSVAHHWYGGFLSAMGRHEQAFAHADTALALDPLAPIIQTWLGLHRYFARMYEDAIVEFDKALRLANDFPPAHWHLSWAYLELNRWPEALAAAHQAVSADSVSLTYQAAVGYASARAGSADTARATLARLSAAASTRYVSAYDIALIHIALGDLDEGLHWLERAYAERSVMIAYLRVDPRLDPVRGDDRFGRLLEKARLDF